VRERLPQPTAAFNINGKERDMLNIYVYTYIYTYANLQYRYN